MPTEYNKTNIPRIIWIYWEQGFENAPFVVQKCVESWEKENPSWEIRLLDKNSVDKYVTLELSKEKLSNLLLAHKSDLIRLKLLQEYGGVWADATTYCMKPLDDWLDDVTKTGFFVFHQPGPDRLLSNWFIVSEKNSVIVAKWYKLLSNFWERNNFKKPGRVRNKMIQVLNRFFNKDTTTTKYWFLSIIVKVLKIYPYPVMHYLFERLITNDLKCRSIWEKTIKISADGPHELQVAGLLSSLTGEHKKLIDNSTVPVYKLTYKNFDVDRYPSSLLHYLFEGRSLEK